MLDYGSDGADFIFQANITHHKELTDATKIATLGTLWQRKKLSSPSGTKRNTILRRRVRLPQLPGRRQLAAYFISD
jgi:hypothetical protein